MDITGSTFIGPFGFYDNINENAIENIYQGYDDDFIVWASDNLYVIGDRFYKSKNTRHIKQIESRNPDRVYMNGNVLCMVFDADVYFYDKSYQKYMVLTVKISPSDDDYVYDDKVYQSGNSGEQDNHNMYLLVNGIKKFSPGDEISIETVNEKYIVLSNGDDIFFLNRNNLQITRKLENTDYYVNELNNDIYLLFRGTDHMYLYNPINDSKLKIIGKDPMKVSAGGNFILVEYKRHDKPNTFLIDINTAKKYYVCNGMEEYMTNKFMISRNGKYIITSDDEHGDKFYITEIDPDNFETIDDPFYS